MESKNHILLVFMVGLIVLLMWQFMPKPEAPPEEQIEETIDTGDYVRIHSASWGLNCIDPAAQGHTDALLAKDDKVMKLRRDNVLSFVSKQCNGKDSCEVMNSPATFDASDDKNPQKNCEKDLEIEYRCFTFDRLWKKVSGHREPVKIECKREK